MQSLGLLAWAGGVLVAAVLPPLGKPSPSTGLIRFGHLPVLMLRFKPVQEDLKVTQDQLKKYQELRTGMRDKMLSLIENGEREKVRAVVDEEDKNLRQILTPLQRKRLQQIYLQVQGLWAMTQADTAKELQLTPEQRQKLRDLQAETEKQFEKAVEKAGSRTEIQKKLAEHHAAANDKGLLMLTAKQRDKWKEMIGEPFKGEIPHEVPKAKVGSRPGE